MLWRFDLHLHTTASPDSLLTPARLWAACCRRGLNGVAVTDHNSVAGALKLAQQAPPGVQIIVGEEVLTTHGELLGLFLREAVASGLTPEETARAIRAQGGIVGVSHPYDPWRCALDEAALLRLWQAGLLDFVEGRNGRIWLPRHNRRAVELGRRLGLPLSAGSDAHGAWEVGCCTAVLPAFSGPQEFLASLERGHLEGRPSPPWARLSSRLARLRRQSA